MGRFSVECVPKCLGEAFSFGGGLWSAPQFLLRFNCSLNLDYWVERSNAECHCYEITKVEWKKEGGCPPSHGGEGRA